MGWHMERLKERDRVYVFCKMLLLFNNKELFFCFFSLALPTTVGGVTEKRERGAAGASSRVSTLESAAARVSVIFCFSSHFYLSIEAQSFMTKILKWWLGLKIWKYAGSSRCFSLMSFCLSWTVTLTCSSEADHYIYIRLSANEMTVNCQKAYRHSLCDTIQYIKTLKHGQV